MTRFVVDPWDPGYGNALSGAAIEDSTVQLTAEFEVPTAQWAPIAPRYDSWRPSEVLLVDGVRRIDARVWFHDAAIGTTGLGVAASWAAGVVRMNGSAHVHEARISRAIFTAFPGASDITTPIADYPVLPSAGDTAEELSLALQRKLKDLEVISANAGRHSKDDLLMVDGPLIDRAGLPRSVGYIKTHQRSYLPEELNTVVGSLNPGERSPIFTIGTSWSRHSWYVRLPGGSAAPWSGVVRCECSDSLKRDEASRLADPVTVLLQRLASRPHKDPRAPQNLIPTGGLEKDLRHRLGDALKLHRALVSASR
jgi:hypothetical protein